MFKCLSNSYCSTEDIMPKSTNIDRKKKKKKKIKNYNIEFFFINMKLIVFSFI